LGFVTSGLSAGRFGIVHPTVQIEMGDQTCGRACRLMPD
jgi:hypothetical protein